MFRGEEKESARKEDQRIRWQSPQSQLRKYGFVLVSRPIDYSKAADLSGNFCKKSFDRAFKSG
jgi:hypothetical protein